MERFFKKKPEINPQAYMRQTTKLMERGRDLSVPATHDQRSQELSQLIGQLHGQPLSVEGMLILEANYGTDVVNEALEQRKLQLNPVSD